MHKQASNPPTMPPPAGYSQIVEVAGGTTVHIAGQVAWDETGTLIGEGDFEAQTRQVLSNVVKALEATGATPSDLVKIRIYIVDHDPEKLGIFRRVRDEVLNADPPPASTLVGVERLALPGLLIEVEAEAVVG